MKIIKLENKLGIEESESLNNKVSQFKELLNHLRKTALKENVIADINGYLQVLNAMNDNDKKFGKQLSVIQSKIIKLIEKEHKLVTKGHYRNIWLVLGMAAFGIPLGMAFGISMGNLAFLGLGLPIGLAIGIAVGMSMDNKALTEGRQLDIEIKY